MLILTSIKAKHDHVSNVVAEVAVVLIFGLKSAL